MFVHCVYFWLKPGLDEASVQAFERGLQSLVEIPDVRFGSWGTPADTDRPIIDRSYSYGLICAFDDADGHDAYQVHADHDTFRETCSGYWQQVRIYDFVDPRRGVERSFGE